MSQEVRRHDVPAAFSWRASLRRAAVNAARMMALWAVLGLAAGALLAAEQREGMLLAANMAAGVVVLAPFGAGLGLLGARRRDVLITGMLGVLVAAAGVASLKDVPRGPCLAAGLIVGALVGSTFIAFFFRLPALLLRRVPCRS